ncbi:MAG: hypothetical protein LBT14_03200 [Treponema sp.]|jgi:uroporphyrinogen-III decarboxylase|nr:hypothetical protein [Treponema sp.]
MGLFDLNAYCMGHISGNGIDSGVNERILSFPKTFTAEAEALGGIITKTASGFPAVEYLFSEPDALLHLPSLEKCKPLTSILEELESVLKEKKDKTVLLKVNGPYSVLASLIEPKLLYRWLTKHAEAIHKALKTITAGLAAYIIEAFSRGAKIVSLADPYANVTVLGERHYREFAAQYLVSLLGIIRSTPVSNGSRSAIQLIHLCPHNSIPLVQFGYMQTKRTGITRSAYIDALLDFSLHDGLTILGDQCIYGVNTEILTVLTFY